MIRTHVVVKADEGSGEFWEGGGGVLSCWGWREGAEDGEGEVPLSPFMMTQIREPMHLSMSSAGRERGSVHALVDEK